VVAGSNPVSPTTFRQVRPSFKPESHDRHQTLDLAAISISGRTLAEFLPKFSRPGITSQSSVAELGWVSQLVRAVAASANEKYRVSWENSVRLLLGRSTELSQLLRLDRPASSSSDASELDSGEGLVAR